MPTPKPQFRDLDPRECVALLERHQVGRLAFSRKDRVDIEPIHYVHDDGWLYGRTAPGTKLQSVDWGTRASFEIDDLDPVAREGWSVVAVGPADEIRAAREVATVAKATGLQTWAPGEHDHWVMVTPERLSGRRVRQTV